MRTVREDALLHTGDEDDGELEALGGVDGHHRDGARLARKGVEVGTQGEPLHEGGELLGGDLRARHLGRGEARLGARGRGRSHQRVGKVALGHGDLGDLVRLGVGHAGLAQLSQTLERLGHVVVRLVELLRDAEELSDVLDAAVRLDRVFRLERPDEAGAVDDGLDHARELAVHVACGLDGVGELDKRVAALGREDPRLGRAGLGGREERDSRLGGVVSDLVDAGGADAAARGVDDAQRAHVVVRVDDQLEVGRHVTDLRAVEESRAAHDLVGDARAQEHVFERTGLRVGAVEDRDVVIAGARVVQLLDLGANPAPLVALVRRLEELDLLAVPPIGEQALRLAAHVVAHDRVGRVEDVAGRAVVLLELDHRRVGIVLAEAQDVLDVGATPAVDGLVVIADDHEVLVLAREQVGDGVLNAVGVLVLVDADLAEALLVVVKHLRVLGEKFIRLDQQVVEVHGVGALEALLEGTVDARGSVLDGRLGGALHLVRIDEAVLGLADLGADRVDGALLLVDVEVAHDGLDQALRVIVIVDGEVALVAQKLAVLAQHPHAHGVEGAYPHAARAVGKDLAQTLAHLGRGLVGEGDGQDLPGTDALVVDHVRDAVGEHAGLA